MRRIFFLFAFAFASSHACQLAAQEIASPQPVGTETYLDLSEDPTIQFQDHVGMPLHFGEQDLEMLSFSAFDALNGTWATCDVYESNDLDEYIVCVTDNSDDSTYMSVINLASGDYTDLAGGISPTGSMLVASNNNNPGRIIVEIFKYIAKKLSRTAPKAIPAKKAPLPTPKFKPPTNPAQPPPTTIPPGHRVRAMPPTTQYPNGYWKLEKQLPDGNWQPINPSTMRPGARHETHVPLPGPNPPFVP